MENKSSAHYQRLYRQRLREQGLVKKEVWVLPEHAPLLMAFERKLRQPQPMLASMEKEEGMSMSQIWTAPALHDALSAAELCKGGLASIELIQGAEASLHVTMHDYGDLPLFIAVFGEQIVVEASIGLETMPDGQSCYTMFGALSSASTLSDVVFEIELLADNVIKATEAYEGFLKASA